MYEKTMPSMGETAICKEPRQKTVCDSMIKIRELANSNLGTARAIRESIDCPKEGCGNGQDEQKITCLMDDLDVTLDILKMLNDELNLIRILVG